ncbi:hypothetical protein BCA37_10560 [Mycobacterium sp. djl-10]|nr:hypothetical protein BCA37_10560 [Mycobacterium sp. djl-10]
MTATFSLDEVAEDLRLGDQMRDPVRFLTAQIMSGRITGRKIGRSWRMTRADVDAALETWAARRKTAHLVEQRDEETAAAGDTATPPAPRRGPSAASQRRRLQRVS